MIHFWTWFSVLEPLLLFRGTSYYQTSLNSLPWVDCSRKLSLCSADPLAALFASSQVADAVGIALRDLWELNPRKVEMPFAAILSALVQLGASPSILEGLGLTTERTQKKHLTHETLLESSRRLLAMVKTAGWSVELFLDLITKLFMEYIPVLALSLPMM